MEMLPIVNKYSPRFSNTLVGITSEMHMCGACDPEDDDDCVDCATDLCNAGILIIIPLLN